MTIDPLDPAMDPLTAPDAGPAPGPLPSRADLERELGDAVRRGRWLSDEEQAELALRERLRQERRLKRSRLRLRQGLGLGLLTAACLIPLLWPITMVGGVMLFPRTSRRIAIGLGVAGLALLMSLGLLIHGVSQWLLTPPAPQPSAQPPLERPGPHSWDDVSASTRISRPSPAPSVST
jgi:hypothetical protein